MEVRIPVDTDSNVSYATCNLVVRRGANRPQNVVLTLDDGERQIEVSLEMLRKVLDII